jgi:hypothetical protein
LSAALSTIGAAAAACCAATKALIAAIAVFSTITTSTGGPIDYFTRVVGIAGVLIGGDPLTFPAGPGAIRVPPGPIRSVPDTPAPGAIGTFPGPIPPML